MLVVVGLGPAGPELTTPLAKTALEQAAEAGRLFLRTGRHPAAEPYLHQGGVRTFDGVYESAHRFEAVYDEIVGVLLEAAAGSAGPAVTYAVPGSPCVAEATVSLLRVRAVESGMPIEIIPGLSFADVAWCRLGIDPVQSGVRLVDGASFAVQATNDGGPLLVGQCWSRDILSSIKLAVDEPQASDRAVLLHHLGLPDEKILEVAWPDIDRTIDPDHLTSLYIPGLESPPLHQLAAFISTIERLRHDCPWDREQTHQSLVRHLLEETYEAIEALEALGDEPASATAQQVAHAEEELGDLLTQVIFHAVLGREEGLFSISDIAQGVNDKLVARHPHVFGDVVATTASDVTNNWERIKQQEKQRQHLFEGVPAAMPALARAGKAERKLASVNLGWDERGIRPVGSAAEAGDQLLALARSYAARGIDPEAAVRDALGRLGERVALLEARARTERGVELFEIPPDELRTWWNDLDD